MFLYQLRIRILLNMTHRYAQIKHWPAIKQVGYVLIVLYEISILLLQHDYSGSHSIHIIVHSCS